jgi:hypothetical protein
LSSSCSMSVRHGNRGVSYFFLCFLGSPMITYSPLELPFVVALLSSS